MEDLKRQVAAPRRHKLVGIVKSNSGNKTIAVEVNRLVKNPKYGKHVRRRTKLLAHDPRNTAKLGDTVEISSSRRISKTKSWRLVRVLRSGDSLAAVRDGKR